MPGCMHVYTHPCAIAHTYTHPSAQVKTEKKLGTSHNTNSVDQFLKRASFSICNQIQIPRKLINK